MLEVIFMGFWSKKNDFFLCFENFFEYPEYSTTTGGPTFRKGLEGFILGGGGGAII